IAHLEKAISLADGLADGPAQRLLRLRLQTTYGHALLHGRGHSQPETIAAFARARELVPGIEDPTARFSAYYGMWLGSFVRADLAPMREVAVAAVRDAQHSPGFPAAGRARHVFGVTCWFQGAITLARERALNRRSRLMITGGITSLPPDSCSMTESSPPAGWLSSCGLSVKSIKGLACWTTRSASPGKAVTFQQSRGRTLTHAVLPAFAAN